MRRSKYCFPCRLTVFAQVSMALLVSCGGGGGGGGGESVAPPASPVSPVSPIVFTDTLGGQVVDARTGQSMPAASVAIESLLLATTADANGFFSFESLVQDAVVVQAFFAGYVPAIRRSEALSTSARQLPLRLQSVGITEDFTNDIDRSFTHGGARLTIGAGSLVRDDGTSVSGTLQIEFTHFDLSTSAEESLAAPGAFDRATAASGAAVSIESFGLVRVDIFDGAELVTLAAGHGAELEIALPASVQARFEPDDSIGIWDFDESTATWIEVGEGVVQLASDGSGQKAWVADVAHFSFWNAALAIADTHCVQGLLEVDGEPIVGAEVVAVGESFGGTRVAFSDADGSYRLHVPRASSGRLQVRTNGNAAADAERNFSVPDVAADCTNGRKGAIGPEVQDFSIVLDSCVSGAVFDHAGLPVVDATVHLVPGQTVSTDADGLYCGKSISGTTVFVATSGFASVKITTPAAGGDCESGNCVEADVLDQLPQKGDLVGVLELVRARNYQQGPAQSGLSAFGAFLAGDVDELLGLIDRQSQAIESCEVAPLEEVAGCVVRTEICVLSEALASDLSDIAPVDAGGVITVFSDLEVSPVDLFPGDPLIDLPFEAGVYLPDVENLFDIGFGIDEVASFSSLGGFGIGAVDLDVDVPTPIDVQSPNLENLNIDSGSRLTVSWVPSPGPDTLYIEVCSSILIVDDPPTFEDVCIEKEVSVADGSVVIPRPAMNRLHDPSSGDEIDYVFCMFRLVEGEIEVDLFRTDGEARVRVSAVSEVFATEFVSGTVEPSGAKSKKKSSRADWRKRHEKYLRARLRRQKAGSGSPALLQ